MRTTPVFLQTWLACVVYGAALVLTCPAYAKDTWPVTWRADCVGYHALRLPGEIEYAVLQRRPQTPWRTTFDYPWEPDFESGMGTWGNDWNVVTDRDWPSGDSRIRMTAAAGIDDLKALMNAKNREQQKAKDDLLRQAGLFTEKESMGSVLMQQASELPFHTAIPDRPAFSIQSSKPPGSLDIQVLIGGRIVSTTRKLVGTPQQTVDAFVSQYKPRDPFEVPSGPGVCIPYATMTGEVRPASVGVSIRLLDRPDIVVYLRDSAVDPRGDGPDPKEVLSKEIRLDTHGARDAIASNKLKPFHSVTLAGRRGVGAFIAIFRDPDILDGEERRKAKPVLDWGYVAYSPGDKSAPLGTSSALMFKVMRYSRYAKQPMSESEFRKLAQTIAASIQRRPGAWVPR
jgi:hypothetical protein